MMCRKKYGVLGLIVGLVASTAVGAQPTDETRLWEETGRTLHGTIQVQRGQEIPESERGSFDTDTLEEVEDRARRMKGKARRALPPLKYEVPSATVGPVRVPESRLGWTSEAPDDFVFLRNTEPSAVAPAGFSSVVNEPSVVALGNRVFFTGNWYTASSSDNGQTFSLVNPFTGPFADPPSGSFCCDQVTAHHPSTNTTFYMQQYLNDANTGVQRVSVDQGGDGTFDCFYDLSPQTHGFASGNWSDFPDLVASDGYLYHSSNVFSTGGGGFSGAFVARYNVASLAACSSVPFDTYMDTSGFGSFKLSRGATDTMYFADHISNTSLRIWRWTDGASAPTSFDRNVATWSDSARVCTGPDGSNICGFIDRRLAGAYVADGAVGFVWVASQDGTFPMPYTRFAQFSEPSLTLVGEPLVWSSSIAWVYPSVAVNANGDLGGTAMVAGPALDPACLAWIADDVNGDVVAPLENMPALFGTSGPNINRSGEYNSTHVNYPNDLLWAGSCFAYTSSTAGDARFLLFGREKSGGPLSRFEDGFESGNTSAWSNTVP